MHSTPIVVTSCLTANGLLFITRSSWLWCVNFWPSIKFFKHLWQALGNYNYHFQKRKQIRKSMNFKQDSEREIKRRERVGESDYDLTCTQLRSQSQPYLPEEIWNKFHVRHIPFQTRGTISIFTTHWKLLQPSVEGTYEGHDIAVEELGSGLLLSYWPGLTIHLQCKGVKVQKWTFMIKVTYGE